MENRTKDACNQVADTSDRGRRYVIARYTYEIDGQYETVIVQAEVNVDGGAVEFLDWVFNEGQRDKDIQKKFRTYRAIKRVRGK